MDDKLITNIVDNQLIRIIKWSIIVITITLSILFLSITFKSVINALEDTRPNAISFEGRSDIKYTPNIATFTFTISKEDKTVSIGRKDVTKNVDNIYKFLKDEVKVKSKDLKTVSYNIIPKYDSIPIFANNNTDRIIRYERKFRAYEIAHVTNVIFEDFGDAERSIAFISDNGATNVSGLSFTIREEEREELNKRAEQEAIKDARNQAQHIAKSLGVSVGDIVSYYKGGGYPARRESFDFSPQVAKSLASSDFSSVPFEIGENSIVAVVTITYELE